MSYKNEKVMEFENYYVDESIRDNRSSLFYIIRKKDKEFIANFAPNSDETFNLIKDSLSEKEIEEFKEIYNGIKKYRNEKPRKFTISATYSEFKYSSGKDTIIDKLQTFFKNRILYYLGVKERVFLIVSAIFFLIYSLEPYFQLVMIIGATWVYRKINNRCGVYNNDYFVKKYTKYYNDNIIAAYIVVMALPLIIFLFSLFGIYKGGDLGLVFWVGFVIYVIFSIFNCKKNIKTNEKVYSDMLVLGVESYGDLLKLTKKHNPSHSSNNYSKPNYDNSSNTTKQSKDEIMRNKVNEQDYSERVDDIIYVPDTFNLLRFKDFSSEEYSICHGGILGEGQRVCSAKDFDKGIIILMQNGKKVTNIPYHKK